MCAVILRKGAPFNLPKSYSLYPQRLARVPGFFLATPTQRFPGYESLNEHDLSYRIPESHSHRTFVILPETTSTSKGPKRPMLVFLPLSETL